MKRRLRRLARLPRGVAWRVRRRPRPAVMVAVPDLRGSMDEPDSSTLTRIPQRFSGWCMEGNEPPLRVEVSFNENTRVEAQLRHHRPDVPMNLAEPAATAASGWELWVDLAEWPRGDLNVRVDAIARSGASMTLANRLYMVTGAGLAGSLDVPAEGELLNGELLVVRGWAAIDGGPAARVEVSVDGQVLGLARLCLPRLDVGSLPARRFGNLTGFEYRGLLPETDDERFTVTVEAVGIWGSREVLDTRSVRRVRSTVSAADTERATSLRERTSQVVRPLPAGVRQEQPSLLVFTHSLSIGGGQLYLSDLLTCLAPDVGRCTVVSPTDGALRRDLEALGMDVVVTGGILSPDLERYEGDIRQLSFFIQGTGADVVLVNTLGHFRAVDAASRLGLPTIWSIHESFALDDWLGLNLGDGRWHPYLKQRLTTALASADRLVFEAAATRDLVAPDIDSTRSLVVPYGVNIDAIDRYASSFDRVAARSVHGLPADAVILLAVGVVEERKGHAFLIDAFTEVASAHDQAVLVVVGDHPSPYSRVLHDLIDEAGMGDRTLLLPITPDIWKWYAMSDVLVLASDVESLPRTMLEAMGFGLAVLSTDVFGISAVIDDLRNGWLYPPRDRVGLLAALHRVLRLTPEQRRRVGEAGRETARRDHRREGYGEAYRQMIYALARRPALEAARD